MKIFTIILVLLSCTMIFHGSVFSAPNDWLQKSYRESHRPSGGTGDPYSSEIEAHQMFNARLGWNIGGPESGAGVRDSVFVRFGRFLMRIGVMLSIPILLYGAIKIMLSMGDSGKLTESLKLVGKLILGLILFLSSVMIIFLITSLTRSALPDI